MPLFHCARSYQASHLSYLHHPHRCLTWLGCAANPLEDIVSRNEENENENESFGTNENENENENEAPQALANWFLAGHSRSLYHLFALTTTLATDAAVFFLYFRFNLRLFFT